MRSFFYGSLLIFVMLLIFPLAASANNSHLIQGHSPNSTYMPSYEPWIFAPTPSDHSVVTSDLNVINPESNEESTQESTQESTEEQNSDNQNQDDAQTKKTDKEKDKKNTDRPDRISETKVDALVSAAKNMIGNRASWDCSGFVRHMYQKYLDIELRGATDRLYFDRLVSKEKIGKLKKGTVYSIKVSKNNLRPGDLVFFQNTYNCVGRGHCTTGKNISHVGIYIGGTTIVDCTLGGTNVRKRSLNDYPWYGAKRYYIKR